MTFFRAKFSAFPYGPLSKTISCDSSGHYEFLLDLDSIFNRTVCVYVYQDTLAYNKAFPRKPVKCEILWYNEPHFYSGEAKTANILDNKPVKLDFVLEKKGARIWGLLEVRFMKNKLQVAHDSLDLYYTLHNSLCIVSSFLDGNPNKKIEIRGNAWEETSPFELSLVRAQFVAEKLTTYGVPKNRIKIVADGDSVSKRIINDWKLGRSDDEVLQWFGWLNNNRPALEYYRLISKFEWPPPCLRVVTFRILE